MLPTAPAPQPAGRPTVAPTGKPSYQPSGQHSVGPHWSHLDSLKDNRSVYLPVSLPGSRLVSLPDDQQVGLQRNPFARLGNRLVYYCGC